MKELIGRETEKRILLDTLGSGEAELVAVYGRRRVGKTFLIRQVYQESIVFEISGIHHGDLREQLENFTFCLKRTAPLPTDVIPRSWIAAFDLLSRYLSPLLTNQKKVIFFDEFPWMNSRRSGFLAAFENFWNSWASRQKNLIIVLCGSAASWMIKNVVNNKGGLHNRISQRIRLLPFSLKETESYLRYRRVKLDHYQIIQLYMVMGGIPQYLKEIRPGQSATQNIDRICFTKDGLLHSEFDNLYRSLFEFPDHYIAVIRALAKKSSGLTRNEIITAINIQSGGGVTQLLNDLEESGFISALVPFEKNMKDAVYRLTDEYSLFYIKFMQGNRPAGKDAWKRLAETPSWKSWSGYAFESICIKHIEPIKVALGISGIATFASTWRHYPQKNEMGAQIDLLIDRADQCITICEMKFSINEFIITKSYASELENKFTVFKEQTGSRKTLFLVMLTSFGVKENEYKVKLVQNDLRMDTLFA